MKQLLGAVALASLVLCGAGCSRETQAKRFFDELLFIKEPRTGLCFALYGAGGDSGLMTEVPCEKIPAGMLTEMK